MRAETCNSAILQYKDTIGIHDRGNALCDDDLGGVFQRGAERLTDLCLGRGVNRACRVVEDQDLRLFQQGTGNAETLLLSARYVCAAALDLMLVSVGEALDKDVRLV